MKNRYCKSSKLSERQFRALVKCFSVDLTATQAARMTGLNRNTVNRYLRLIRGRIAARCERESPFAGTVEVDESYFGARRVRGKRGRGATDKTPVFGIFERGGRVYTEVVPNCKKATLQAIIRGKIAPDSLVNSDGWRGYDGLVDMGYVGEDKDTIQKEQSILEMVAYRDMWGRGVDSYIHTMAERLSLMRDLLSDRGSIYVHCDYRVNAYMRMILDEVFGGESFVNEIIWHYSNAGLKATSKKFHQKHDVLFCYSKSEKYIYNGFTEELKGGDTGKRRLYKFDSKEKKAKPVYDDKGNPVYFSVDGIKASSVWNARTRATGPLCWSALAQQGWTTPQAPCSTGCAPGRWCMWTG
jgi:transposase-like protein